MGIIANIKAMIDVQRIKKGGVANFTISSITNLIINLPDAQKTLDGKTFNRVFDLYKQMNRCKTKMKLDFNGYIATAVEILKEFDKIAPCESYLGMEPFEAAMLMKDVRGMQNEFLNKKSANEDDTVIIFHVARNTDGTIQPVVAAPMCPTDTTLIESLLCTENLGVDEVSHQDKDFYYFLFDKNARKPYSSVMILKFIQSAGNKTYVDMQQEDMKAVTYAIENYLR